MKLCMQEGFLSDMKGTVSPLCGIAGERLFFV